MGQLRNCPRSQRLQQQWDFHPGSLIPEPTFLPIIQLAGIMKLSIGLHPNIVNIHLQWVIGYKATISEPQLTLGQKRTVVCHQLLHLHCDHRSLNCSLVNDNLTAMAIPQTVSGIHSYTCFPTSEIFLWFTEILIIFIECLWRIRHCARTIGD